VAVISCASVDADRAQRLKSAPKFVVLMGLPCSGKSYFSSSLVALNSMSASPLGANTWVRVCQDELGSRVACEAAVRAAVATQRQRVIVDRCNVTSEERKLWASMYAGGRGGAVCVWLDLPQEKCVQRIRTRTGHPTITNPEKGNTVHFSLFLFATCYFSIGVLHTQHTHICVTASNNRHAPSLVMHLHTYVPGIS
jgi:hypothetical protein